MIVAADRDRVVPFRFLNFVDHAYDPGPELLVERNTYRPIDVVDDSFVDTTLELLFEKQAVYGDLGHVSFIGRSISRTGALFHIDGHGSTDRSNDSIRPA